MKNEIKKIRGELVKYIKNLDEDTYIPPAGGMPQVAGRKPHVAGGNPQTAARARLQTKASAAEMRVSGPEPEKAAVVVTVSSACVPSESVPGPRKGKKTAAGSDLLGTLREEVLRCRKCLLGLSRLNPVFGVGDPKARVMFVGEGPGYDEDHRGEPFVGRSGQLLDKILAAINLSRQSVYIANIVKCHPMTNPETPEARGNDRPPTPAEISACRGYLEEQIRLIRPLCVVTLGNVATKFMLNETKGISQLRGKMYDVPYSFTFDFDLKILPTYHPAALLRNPNLKKDAWEDMKMLKSFLEKNNA
ncbi:MAG: uracil-DNA glycosylase [Elusimicrobia bacterium CG08_land_8_20_14_0_20_51_18]|nr:MAG: uracil-DNA glycosylase [Elusimicrobia bacterium CG08_land_8_20_14_0_20_51_18]